MRTGWPVLTEHRRLRLLTVGLLYLAQGVWIGVFTIGLPAWLTIEGASPAQVGGFAGLVFLPWSLKLVSGAIMDRYAWLPMGRRRAWLLGAQATMIVALLLTAVLAPGVERLALLTALVFGINVAVAFQDVAIDSLAIDVLPAEERAQANGLMFGAQSLGMAGGGLVAGYLLQRHGLATTATAIAAFLGTVMLLPLALRERRGEKLLPWTAGRAAPDSVARHAGAWRPIIASLWQAFTRPASLCFAAAVAFGNVAFGISVGSFPAFAADPLGWDEAHYAGIAGSARLIGGVAGILVIGLLVRRLGAGRTLAWRGVVLAVLAVTMALARGWWETPGFFAAFVIAFALLDVLASVGIATYAMDVCPPAIAATLFTLYMALSNLAGAAGAALLGPLSAHGGHATVFVAMAVASLLGTLAIVAAERLPR